MFGDGHRIHCSLVREKGISLPLRAVVNGHVEVACLLAAACTDRSIEGTGAPGFHSNTAADLAREQGLRELVDELSR